MEDNNKKETSSAKTLIIAIIMVIIVLFYFNHLSNKSSEKRTEKAETELELLSAYDMLGEYPKTPRDVVKLHCRYFKMFYGESLSDDELVILNEQVRYLYSSDLMMLNDENTNLKALKKNIEKMKKEGYTYKSYELPEASQIIYYTQDGVEMATLEVTVTVDMEDSMGYMYIQYVLVKEFDQWKIKAWGDSRIGE
ncbi:MAG: hypothetical protein E7258_02170 [Lachnospiraceae bacterium]|nr:hypothetical protein [Lachnospiraceae bacterium]